MKEKGYTQLYTGDGKGKTTAALGLAFRAAGCGLKSLFIQFMKGQHYSELDSIAGFKGLIKIEQYGSKQFCMPDDENFEEHYKFSIEGMKRAHQVLESNNFDIVVLDEIVTALFFNIITMDEIRELVSKKPENMELVLTGRRAPQSLIEICDLVTEMKEIKHYYTQGVSSRKGIEN